MAHAEQRLVRLIHAYAGVSFWRRDRNTLTSLPARRKAVQGPCQNGGSCMLLRISFGAECIFLYIGFGFAPELYPKSISESQHCHNTPPPSPAFSVTRLKSIRLAFTLSAFFRYPQIPTSCLISTLVGASLDNKHHSRLIQLRYSENQSLQRPRKATLTTLRKNHPTFVVSLRLRSRPRLHNA